MSTAQHPTPRFSIPTPDELEAQNPEEFEYSSADRVLLIQDMRRLPPQLWKATVYLLRSGYASRFVTRFLLAEGYRGGVQHLSEQELLFRVECLRRQLKPFPADSRSKPQARTTRHTTSDTAIDSVKVGGAAATGDAEVRRRIPLLWWLSQVPLPRQQEFLRVLMQGGEVDGQVLRLATQLKAGTIPKSNAVDGTGPARPRARRRGRGLTQYRAEKGPGMLRSLSRLPLPVLQHAIFLLVNGVSALAVARFILCHDDLGPGVPRSENSMRQYVGYLLTFVGLEAQPSARRQRLLHQVAQDIREQQVRHRMAVMARRLSASGSEDPRATLGVPEVASLAALKAELMELFTLDPKALLINIVTLRLINPDITATAREGTKGTDPMSH